MKIVVDTNIVSLNKLKDKGYTNILTTQELFTLIKSD